MNKNLTLYEIGLILSADNGSESIEVHTINPDKTENRLTTIINELIKNRSLSRLVFLLNLPYSDGIAAAYIFLDTKVHLSLINFTNNPELLDPLRRVLTTRYTSVTPELLTKEYYEFLMPLPMENVLIKLILDKTRGRSCCSSWTNITAIQSQHEKILSEQLKKIFPEEPLCATFLELGGVSLSIWLASIAQTATIFINLAVYNRSSDDNLSSSVIVVTLQRLILALSASSCVTTQIHFSQGLGENPEKAGKFMQVGWLMALLLGGLSAAISIFFIKPFLFAFKQPERIIETASTTFSSLAMGFFGYSLFTTNGRVLISLGKQNVYMISNIFSAILGIIAVHGFSCGAFGFPNLGSTAGYGWGFAVQTWSACIPTTIYLLLSQYCKKLKFLGTHEGVFIEVFKGLRHAFAIFFQKNSDILSACGLAIFSGLLGKEALLAENVAESYRICFGRSGGSAVANAVLSSIAKIKGNLNVVAGGKLCLSEEKLRIAISSLEKTRISGYMLSTIYGGFWLILYIAMPKILSSVFLNSQYLNDNYLMNKVTATLILSGLGQLFDDIRQVQMSNQNAHKRIKSATCIPITLNLISTLISSYIFAISCNAGVIGLEIPYAFCFALSVLAFKVVIDRDERQYSSNFFSQHINAEQTKLLVTNNDDLGKGNLRYGGI